MSEKELEKIRTAVVVKTYSSLIRQHQYRTPEEVASQLMEVKKFGKALFLNIRGSNPQKKTINLQDICLFFKDDKEGRANAARAFRIFSRNPQDQITKQQVIETVEQLFKERSDIATSLSNTDSMMNSLEAGLAGVLHFFAIGVYLLVWYGIAASLSSPATKGLRKKGAKGGQCSRAGVLSPFTKKHPS
mmetsp:Transcript_11428/g.27132  ORF Transcript_11428/g.27132 Transcript_11428/m.27132 type:complete len:189 (+) Transcript_11428:507-1073(+)